MTLGAVLIDDNALDVCKGKQGSREKASFYYCLEKAGLIMSVSVS